MRTSSTIGALGRRTGVALDAPAGAFWIVVRTDADRARVFLAASNRARAKGPKS